MSRFDSRSEKEFKKDIYFGTLLEKYLFNEWQSRIKDHPSIEVTNPKDNGADNTGKFIASGKTSGADYRVDIVYEDFRAKSHPLEIKWVPTYGKLTLKLGDLKGYDKEGASILFIYSSENHGIDLRKPKDYDFTNHVNRIAGIAHQLRWGLLTRNKLKEFLQWHSTNNLVKPIKYMGNKPGIVLQQEDFHKWFKEEKWFTS